MEAREFEDAMREGRLRLAFVGMSNAGKTKSGRALEKAFGFHHVEVDRDISEALGMQGTAALASWLGYPDSAAYAEREQQYLELEEEHTVRQCAISGNVVLDTTGSVVHLPERARKKVKDSFFVVHLDVGEAALDVLIERFFRLPKPVIWDTFFSKELGETTRAALERSYPALMQERLQRFRTLAHINIPALQIDVNDGRAIIEAISAALV